MVLAHIDYHTFKWLESSVDRVQRMFVAETLAKSMDEAEVNLKKLRYLAMGNVTEMKNVLSLLNTKYYLAFYYYSNYYDTLNDDDVLAQVFKWIFNVAPSKEALDFLVENREKYRMHCIQTTASYPYLMNWEKNNYNYMWLEGKVVENYIVTVKMDVIPDASVLYDENWNPIDYAFPKANSYTFIVPQGKYYIDAYKDNMFLGYAEVYVDENKVVRIPVPEKKELKVITLSSNTPVNATVRIFSWNNYTKIWEFEYIAFAKNGVAKFMLYPTRLASEKYAVVVEHNGSFKMSKIRVLDNTTFVCDLTPIQAKIIVPNDYPTIQQAINAASPGETIVVKDGIYKENVKVNKSVTIISENGSANCIVKAANDDHVFEITADNVTISGFTITGAGFLSAGIRIEANNSVITNNNVENNNYGGIRLWHSSNNSITNNKFTNDGLVISNSYNNTITNNTVNGKPLVYLENVNDYVVSNIDAGQVIAVKCNNITVKNLNLSNTAVGIEFCDTNNSRIEDVVVENNGEGIRLDDSNNNSVTNNNVMNNDFGIDLYYYSSNNTIVAGFIHIGIPDDFGDEILRPKYFSLKNAQEIFNHQLEKLLDFLTND